MITYAPTSAPTVAPFLVGVDPGKALCFAAAGLSATAFFALTKGLEAGWQTTPTGSSVFLRAVNTPPIKFTFTGNATGIGGTSASVTATVNTQTADSANEWEFPLGDVFNWKTKCHDSTSIC
jgi:hypothetical protein